MAKVLTKQSKVDAEQLRISRLTNAHDAYFKFVFSHQLENAYGFGALDRQKVSKGLQNHDVVEILKFFGKFLDDAITLTITDAENKYGRETDNSDGTYDPELDCKTQIEHFCIYPPTASPQQHIDRVRVHGYFRGSYFVVTKMDWFHSVHA